MKQLICIAAFASMIHPLCAQDVPQKKYGIVSDCKQAIGINLQKNTIYGPTPAPFGYGDVQEMPAKRKWLFEKEHFTAWYLLSMERDGEFVFEVVPTNPKDDYDFIVYRYDEKLCNRLKAEDCIPIRSNLSRVDKSIQGISGLMANVKNTNVGMGIGNAYCQSMNVKKGEKYMLVLDNVYPQGDGHTLYFNFLKQMEIKGKVTDSNNTPVEAEVSLSDNFGNIVETIKSNANGEYDMKTFMKEGEMYNLSIHSPNTFISTRQISTYESSDGILEASPTVLPVLKQGEKYNLGNILFYGDLPDLLPVSYPAVEALYQLMEKNKKLVIQIEGHVNKGTISNEQEEQLIQQLSEQRAQTIYHYLVKKGISKDRLSTVGLSYSQMLYPHPRDPKEQEANRRVDIKITSMD